MAVLLPCPLEHHRAQYRASPTAPHPPGIHLRAPRHPPSPYGFLLRAFSIVLACTVVGPGTVAQAANATPRSIAPRGPLAADELNNIAVFKAASPAVVNITALATQRDLFSLNSQQVPHGTGTGFLWDTQGHIVTNFHVIQDANGAQVTLGDQSSFRAELVGAAPDRDLAVLRIKAPESKLSPIAMGSSRDVQVGQKVYAIGNPFGLDQTLTTGIISALNREIESVTRRTIRGVIQTDAAINPGNSGGPLLDSAGRLIGVNTAIYSPTGASAGIGFAIPVDEVNRIVPRLIRDGRLIRPALGITGGPHDFNRSLNLPKGVPLVDVDPTGPAQQAGLAPFRRNRRDGGIIAGDVITAVNGIPIGDMDDLLTELEKARPGDVALLTLWRAGQTRQVRVPLVASHP